MKKYIISLILLVSTNSLAGINYARGEWGSGGGNAIVCFKQVAIGTGETSINIISEIKKNNNTIADDYLPYIESIEMFDLYDAKRARGLNPSKPELVKIQKNEEFFDYATRVANRFSKTNAHMLTVVNEGMRLLPETSFVMHEYGVKYQNDLGSVVLPSEKCVISTMAAQVNSNDFYEAHVDRRLFFHPKHSKQSQATLVLHELVYAYARKNKQKDSSSTRSLVRFYISYDKTITELTTTKALEALGFNEYENFGDEYDYHIEYKQFRNSTISNYAVNGYEIVINTIIGWLEQFSHEHITSDNKKLHQIYSELLKKQQQYGGEVVLTENVLDNCFNLIEILKGKVSETKVSRWYSDINYELTLFKRRYNQDFNYIVSDALESMKRHTLLQTNDYKIFESNMLYIKEDLFSMVVFFDGKVKERITEWNHSPTAKNYLYRLLPYWTTTIEDGVVRSMQPLNLNQPIAK